MGGCMRAFMCVCVCGCANACVCVCPPPGLIFSIGAGINIFGAIVFLVFAKGEPQFD
jgi:hypothetical protein